MRPRRLLLAAAVTTGLVLTGCSSDASQDEPVQIAQDYVTAVLEGDADTVCELSMTDGEPNESDEDLDNCKQDMEPFLNPDGLSDEDQEKFEADREKALDELDRDSFEETTEDDAEDDEATVAFTLEGNDESVDLKKVDEKWYIALT